MIKVRIQLYDLILIIIFIMCYSCGHEFTKNKPILEAERLMVNYPDSAYKILISLPNPENLSKQDYAAWCLQFTQAQLKMQLPIESDSIITYAVNYYKHSNLTTEKGLSLYLEGCVYRLHGKYKESMLDFKLAGDVLKETTEYNQYGLVNFNIGYLYFQDDLFNESLKYFNKSLLLFKKSNNKKYQAFTYRAIADSYHQLDNSFAKILFNLDKSISLAKVAGDSINYYTNISRKGEILYNRDYNNSKRLLLRSYNALPYKRIEIASFLSYVYVKLNQLDSSRYYYNIANNEKATSNKTLLYLTGAYQAKYMNDYSRAFSYFEKVYSLQDSISRKNITDQLSRIDKQYDFSKEELKSEELRIKVRNNVIWITILIIAVLIACIVILLILRSRKRRQVEHDTEKQQLEFEIKTRKMENDQKREKLLIGLQNKIENTLRLENLKIRFNEKSKMNDFVEEMTKQSIISDKERDYYIDEVDNLYDGKIKKLLMLYPDSTKFDLIVIALICLSIDISDSCTLLNMSLNTMYVRRKRIKKHLKLPTEVDMENWVYHNVVKTS